MEKYIVVDIGGTSIKYGLMDHKMNFLDRQILDTNASNGGKQIIDKVKDIIYSYKADHELMAICISTAGVVDYQDGSILHASSAIPAYTGIQIKKIFESEFQIPCFVENDVNCAGYAEACMGNGKDSEILVCLTIGTGIGGCLIVDNKVFHGTSCSAMEVGYINIDGQAFQDIASTSALIKQVTSLKQDHKQYDGKSIIALSKEGDELCIQAVKEWCHNLAKGIATVCYVTNPDTIILGGGIMNEYAYLLPKIHTYLKEILGCHFYQNINVTYARHKNDAGMLGAYLGYKTLFKADQ